MRVFLRRHGWPLLIALITAAAMSVIVVGHRAYLADQDALIREQERTIEQVRGAQECVIRLLLVEPGDREGFKVDRIMESCPGALPEREVPEQAEPDPDARQPWEAAE